MTVGSARPRPALAGRDKPARTPLRMMPLKIMIVDDSITARTVHSRIVAGDEMMAVTAIAGTAEQAIRLLATVQIDVILLDLEMPGIGGLDALPRLIEAARGARILVVSGLTIDGAQQTLAALAQGAADTMPKPLAGQFDQGYRDALLTKIRTLGRSAHQLAPATRRPALPVPLRPGSLRRPQVLGIGASTGGIHALGQLLEALPQTLDLPILVTQHLPASFMPVFANQLHSVYGRDALVAIDDAEVLPGRILIAPGDAHLGLRRQGSKLRVKLDRTPAASGCTPSVDTMFSAIAATFGSDGLGIVLSGMGRDGAEGAGRIVAAGGAIFAQDEASCAVWGMPRAVAEAGLASAVLPPAEIASRIAAAMRATGARPHAWK